MGTIHNWRIYCDTEGSFIYGYLPEGTDCTVCFNNNTHAVNPNSSSIVSTVSENTTLIATQETGSTAGNFRAEKKKLICLPGSVDPGVITKQVVSFPYDLNILSFSVQIREENVGDMIEMVISPLNFIGVLSAELVSGSVTIVVSVLIMSLVNKGYQLVFTNPSNGFVEETPEILSLDTVTNTLTFITPTVTTFPAGSYIKFQLKRLKTFYIGAIGNLVIGNYLRASLFPTTVQSEIRYTNFSVAAKTFYYGIEYLY
jgi:hypothetical protein